jgi:hypothetical protein
MTKYILSIFILIVTGCATLNEREMLKSLEAVTDKYENSIRWGNYEQADSFIKKSEGSENDTPDFAGLKKIKVSLYKVLNRDVEKEELRAMQLVEISYYHIDYMIEKVLIDKQLWEYDAPEKKWHLKSGFPDFEY